MFSKIDCVEIQTLRSSRGCALVLRNAERSGTQWESVFQLWNSIFLAFQGNEMKMASGMSLYSRTNTPNIVTVILTLDFLPCVKSLPSLSSYFPWILLSLRLSSAPSHPLKSPLPSTMSRRHATQSREADYFSDAWGDTDLVLWKALSLSLLVSITLEDEQIKVKKILV